MKIMNNSLRRIISFCFCLIFFATLIPKEVMADEGDSVFVTADTYVSSLNPAENYSTRKELVVSASAEDTNKAYVSFYVGALPEGDYNIYFHITPIDIQEGEEKGKVNLYSSADHELSQGRIDYTTLPVHKTKLAQLDLVEGVVCEVDVTDYVKENMTKRGYISFVVAEETDTGSVYKFASSDSGSYAPELYLETGYISEEVMSNEVPATSTGQSYAVSELGEENSELELLPIRDVSGFDIKTIEKYTTTRYEPWLVNYHLTDPRQVAAGRSGGDHAQIIFSIALCPNNPDKMLVSSDCEGIFRSDDGGESFYPTAKDITVYGVNYVSYYPVGENIAFALAGPQSTGNGGTRTTASTGIWKTTDGGATWTQKQQCAIWRNRNHKRIVYGAELNENGVYPIFVASHGDGILRSDDLGETWKKTGPDLTATVATDATANIDLSGNVIVLSANTKGVFVSEDGGETWEARNNGFDLEKEPISGITIDPRDKNHLIACSGERLYRTYDCGRTWEAYTDRHKLRWSNLTGLDYGPIREDGSARLYIMGTQSQYSCRYSDDDGETAQLPKYDYSENWSQWSWGWNHHSFAVHDKYPDLCYVSWGAVLKSIDGFESVKSAGSGMSGHRATQWLFSEKNPGDIITAHVDMGTNRSMPIGDEWYPMADSNAMNGKYVNHGTTNGIARDPSDYNHILIVNGGWGTPGTMYESFDNGYNFFPANDLGAIFLGKMFWHPQNPNIIYCGKHISRDGGETWEDCPYQVWAMCESNGDIVYAKNGNFILISEDAGKTWTQFIEKKISGLQQITIDLDDPYKLYCGSSSSGYYVVDRGVIAAVRGENGITPSPLGKVPAIYQVAQNPKNHDHLIAVGMDVGNRVGLRGFYESFDRGQTYRTIAVPVNLDMWAVQFHPTRSQVFIATSYGTWVYEYENYGERPEDHYIDISDSYCRDSVLYMLEKGYFKTSEYNFYDFEPDKEVSKKEFLQMIIKEYGLKRIRFDNMFEDENPHKLGYATIQIGLENGLVLASDATDGNVNINDAMTNSDMANYIVRLLNLKGMDTSVNASEIRKFYNSDTSYSMANAMAVLYRHGILKDNDEFKLVEKDKAVRGVCAVVLERTFKLLK